MTITQKQIELIADFVSSWKNPYSRYEFPEASAEISKLLGEDVRLYACHYHKTQGGDYFTVQNDRLYMTLSQDGALIWKPHFGDGVTVDQLRDRSALLHRLYDNMSAIEAIHAGVQEDFMARIAFDKLAQTCEWLLGRVNDFFDYFSPDAKPIDSELKLKDLYKIKIENWPDGMYKHYDGKNASINWYRTNFELWADCVRQVADLKK